MPTVIYYSSLHDFIVIKYVVSVDWLLVLLYNKIVKKKKKFVPNVSPDD